MARFLGIDYGKKRIGIAITDESNVMALPLKVLTIRSMQDGIEQIATLSKDYELEGIVMGLPLNMDGSEGTRVREVRKFVEQLSSSVSCPIHFEDERLSSMEAESRLMDTEMNRKKRTKMIDAVAAQVILQSFLSLNP